MQSHQPSLFAIPSRHLVLFSALVGQHSWRIHLRSRRNRTPFPPSSPLATDPPATSTPKPPPRRSAPTTFRTIASKPPSSPSPSNATPHPTRSATKSLAILTATRRRS